MTVCIFLPHEKVVKVDDEDRDLADHSWCITNGYVHRTFRRKGGKHGHENMHRTILSRVLGRPLLKSEIVDHINHDKLDNRRANLRLANGFENMHNQRRHIDNSSGYKGIYPQKNSPYWIARISVQGKRHYLGNFRTPEAAARAYDAAARELHGDFAFLNFPDEQAS